MLRYLPFVAVLFSGVPATATIIMVDASSIQGENVLLNNGQQSGTTIFGFTNQSSTQVVFNSSQVLRGSGGQAVITGDLNNATNPPNDTVNFNNFELSLAGGTLFNDAEFNLMGGNATSVSFTVIDNEGQSFNFANLVLGNGENRFGFQGILGESIASIRAMTSGGTGIQSLRQVRLIENVAIVPEPATWAMMIGGFGLVGAAARRRQARSVTT